jgi:type IX secretion system PorP/SprF family membrane protein
MNQLMKYKTRYFLIRRSVKFGIRCLLFFWTLSFASEQSYAQQRPIFTQYMFNGLVLNPAYSGSHESMTLTASVRSQWSGIKGAPQTQVFSAHTPIKFSRSAGGMVVTHDKAGVIDQTMFYATYAYHIPVSDNGKISVGGQAGATYYQANYANLNIVSQNNSADIAFAGNESRLMPNLGIGAYYYSKTTYIGLSLPALINNKWNNYNELEKSTQQRHYFLTAGHVFDLTPDLKLKPNVLLKWVENGPFQYDLNANLFIKKILMAGLSYRMGDSMDVLFQWNINDQLAFGYSYGYPTNALAPVQWGTHEIVLNYRLKRDMHIIRSPRYF